MKSSYKKYKYTSEELAEILYDIMFTKRYSANDKIFDSYFEIYEQVKNPKQFILDKLRAGADVRTGYTCTSIKGVHDYFIAVGGFAD
jgi:hypothetical protein